MAKIALLIGVSQYEPGLTALPATEKDVAAVQAVLQDPAMGAFDQVTPLINPGLVAMRTAIDDLFSDRDRTDLLLLYFAGHGIADQMGKFWFTNRETKKTRQGNLKGATAVEASFVHTLMDSCRSDRQVIILDCCNSWAFPEDMKVRDDGDLALGQQLGGRGRVVLTAASAASKYALEAAGDELAFYTRYLVEGIKTGAADLDGDGHVSVDELHEYITTQLRTAAPAMRPERYVVREGEKILLAQAVVSDPKRRYRKLVQEYSGEGEIFPAERRLLDRQMTRLGLTAAEALAIEDEVLKPYREHQANLREYAEVLQLEMARQYPFSDRTQRTLKALQKELGLTDDNIATIAPPPPPVAPTPPKPFKPNSTTPLPPPSPEAIASPSPIDQPFEFEIATIDQALKITRRQGHAAGLRERLTDQVGLDLIKIPAGQFLMGAAKDEVGASSDEYPQHAVTVPSFYLGRYPVTQAQWAAIAALPKINQDLNPDPANFKGSDRPVEKINWWEAVEFCDRLSRLTGRTYRLPSEAEWEYACRAGTPTPFHFGDTITPDLANYNGNYTYGAGKKGEYRQQTTSVGQFAANAFGVYDMHGNVWEWCLDHKHDNYDGAPTNGSAWLTKNNDSSRLLRGGAWGHVPQNCRAAFRFWLDPADRYDCIGLRVVAVIS